MSADDDELVRALKPIEDDDQSVVVESEKITQERYEDIKARTMFGMVEDVSPTQSLLFLTNAQAEVLSQTDSAIAKMLDALELPTAKLLIILQPDMCSPAWCRTLPKEMGAGNPRLPASPNGPFASPAEANEANAKLERFILEVIIPLAVQTNAIVLCTAVQENGFGAVFNRMVRMQQSKFSGKMPFSVIAMTDETSCFYSNINLQAHWRRPPALE